MGGCASCVEHVLSMSGGGGVEEDEWRDGVEVG